MRYPGSMIIAILETISYDTHLSITRFPCSATVRQELANCLVDIGFIELSDAGYTITTLGEIFLNNNSKKSKL